MQAAEHAVRAETVFTGINELTLLGAKRWGDSMWKVRFGGEAGTLYEVDVEAQLGALTYLTCSAPALRRPRLYVTSGYRTVALP